MQLPPIALTMLLTGTCALVAAIAGLLRRHVERKGDLRPSEERVSVLRSLYRIFARRLVRQLEPTAEGAADRVASVVREPFALVRFVLLPLTLLTCVWLGEPLYRQPKDEEQPLPTPRTIWIRIAGGGFLTVDPYVILSVMTPATMVAEWATRNFRVSQDVLLISIAIFVAGPGPIQWLRGSPAALRGLNRARLAAAALLFSGWVADTLNDPTAVHYGQPPLYWVGVALVTCGAAWTLFRGRLHVGGRLIAATGWLLVGGTLLADVRTVDSSAQLQSGVIAGFLAVTTAYQAIATHVRHRATTAR